MTQIILKPKEKLKKRIKYTVDSEKIQLNNTPQLKKQMIIKLMLNLLHKKLSEPQHEGPLIKHN
jgi:hypothetical protein